MAISIQYQMTPKESLAAQRVSRRWVFWTMISLGILMLILVGVRRLQVGEWTAEHTVFTAYGLIAVVFPELWIRWIAFRMRHALGLPVEMTFDEGGIAVKSPQAESRVMWSLFKSARLRSGFWLLKLSPYQSIAIPQRAFESGLEGGFIELLQQAGLTKA